MSEFNFWSRQAAYFEGNVSNYVGIDLSGTRGLDGVYMDTLTFGIISRPTTTPTSLQTTLYSIGGYFTTNAGIEATNEFASKKANFPYIYHITTQKVSASGIFTRAYYGFSHNPQNASGAVTFKSDIPKDTFLEQYGDWEIVTGITLYNDTTIPRTVTASNGRGNGSFALLSLDYYTNRYFWNTRSGGSRTYETQDDYPKIAYFNQFQPLVWTGNPYNYAIVDIIHELGGLIVNMRTSITESSTYPSGADTAVIYPPNVMKTVINKLIADDAPLVINNPQLATHGDVKDFTDWIPSGTAENVTGGGEGEGDNFDDPTDSDNDEPTLSPMASGCDLWAVDGSELKLICDFMWSGHNKDVTGVPVTETDITRAWIDCFYVPFDIRLHDSAHVDLKNVTVAGYEMKLQCFAIKNGYSKTFDFGTISVPEYYGSYLDYAPYTSINIYLPYIGFKPLDVNKVMGKTLGLQYKVDFSTGMCTAFLSYTNQGNKQIFAMYSGQMGVPVRITGLDESSAMRSALSFAANVAACGVAVIPSLGATGAANVGGLLSSGAEFLNNVSFETGAGGTISVRDKAAEPLSIGTAGAENWLTAPQKAYILIQRAQTNTPENYADINGWATCYCGTISEFTGFLKCANVTCNVGCTEDERNLIIANLVKGVYI